MIVKVTKLEMFVLSLPNDPSENGKILEWRLEAAGFNGLVKYDI